MAGQAVIVRISRFIARHNRAEPIGGETTNGEQHERRQPHQRAAGQGRAGQHEI